MITLTAEQITAQWPDVHERFDCLETAYAAMSENLTNHEILSTNYYRWIASALEPYLGNRTMEFGAGPGLLTRQMRKFDFYLSTEGYKPFVDKLENLMAERSDLSVELFDMDSLDSEIARLRELRLDSLFSSNLLEHLKDDVGALSSMAKILNPGGRIVHFVPALRALYGEADRTIGHFRRYERAEVIAKAEAAGLIVERAAWFNIAGVFAWIVVNKILRQQNTSGGQFSAFNKMVPVFRSFEKIFPTFIGASLVLVARVPGEK